MQIERGFHTNRTTRRKQQSTPLRPQFFLAFAIASAVSFGTAQAADYTFNTVQVVGLEHIEQGTVLSYAGIAKGKTLSDADLNDAYQRINASGLFQSVVLEPVGHKLVIKVKEFPLVDVINFEGNKMIKSADLAKIIKSQSRRVYSPSQAEADAAAITEAYRTTKRYGVIVTPKIIPRPNNRVDLAFDIKEGRATYVDRLSFIGNHDFSQRRLRQVMATKQVGLFAGLISGNSYRADRLDQDKQALSDFYQSRGYIDFRILDATSQLQRNRKGFFLTFSIHEGQPYTIASTSVTTDLKDINAQDFTRFVKISHGQTYSPTAIENAVTRIENEAARRGLNFIRAVPKVTRDDHNLSVSVDFQIERGPKVFVERIDIQGNATTQDRVIRRQFRTAEGDPLNPREIKAASDRIKALGYFKDAQVTTKQGDAPDQAIVNVNVTEQPTGSLSFGGTYGINTGFGLLVSYGEQNFLGRGQTLNANINTTKANASSDFTFIEPALLGRDLRFSLSGQYTISTHSYANYDTRIASLSPGLEFPVSTLGRLGINYRIADAKMSNVDSTASAIIKREAGSRTASSVGYSYSWDLNRDGLSPVTDLRFVFSQDFAGLGGQSKYIKTVAQVTAETKVLREEVTLRGQLEGGALSMLGGQSSTATDRYFLNGKMIGFNPNGLGPRDLTAVGQDALGGTMYAVAKLESEFPLGFPAEYGINGGVFLNAGSVWGLSDTAGTAGAVDDKFHLRATTGVSIFWNTVIGPLRFDFAKPLIKESYDRPMFFNFTIASKF
jgi:outer membrane protein insertion porin family